MSDALDSLLPLGELVREAQRADRKHGAQLDRPLGDTSGLFIGTAVDADHQAELARQEVEQAAANGSLTWAQILEEEYREALAELDLAEAHPHRPDAYAAARAELVQVAATAARMVRAIDHQQRQRATARKLAEQLEATTVRDSSGNAITVNSVINDRHELAARRMAEHPEPRTHQYGIAIPDPSVHLIDTTRRAPVALPSGHGASYVQLGTVTIQLSTGVEWTGNISARYYGHDRGLTIAAQGLTDSAMSRELANAVSKQLRGRLDDPSLANGTIKINPVLTGVDDPPDDITRIELELSAIDLINADPA
jgi:hypothetical protein